MLGLDILLPEGGKTDSDEWGTPQWLFDALDKEFGFNLDPCAAPGLAKCARSYSMVENGLLQDWGNAIAFVNPPYSRADEWMRKAYGSAVDGATVVCLVAARTDTGWWHDYAMKGEIRLIRGRLKFGDSVMSAPFPSAIVIFRPRTFKLVSWMPPSPQR